MDKVPILIRSALASPHGTDEDVLEESTRRGRGKGNDLTGAANCVV